MNNTTNLTVAQDGAAEDDFRTIAKKHLQLYLSRLQQGQYLEVRTFAEDGKKDKGRQRWIEYGANESKIEAVIEWAASESTEGRGVYLSQNSRAQTKGSKTSVTHVTCCYVDADVYKPNKTKAELTAFINSEACPLKPSLVVFSGQGFQLVYFVEPSADKKLWARVNQGIAACFREFGADPACESDESRVLRLTPFPNNKPDVKRATAIISHEEREPISLEGLAECFKAHLPQSDGKKIDLNAMRKPKAMPKVIPEHGGEDCAGRNSEMFIEACKLFRDDKSLEEVRGILSVLNARCVPPLDAEEIAKLATNAEKSVEEQRAGQVNGAAKIEERCTDIANAEGFVGMFGEQFCYVPEKSALTVWDGERWNIGENAAHAVKTLAMDYAKTKFDEAKNAPEHERARLGKHAIYSNNSRGVESFLRLVPGVRGVAVSIQKFDSAPDSLNVLNGTIDLRTGELKPHRRKDCHTKLAQAVYDPDAKAPRWESFLTEIFKGDAELVSYMQRAIGYSLTGRTREEVFFLLYGDGRNGKGTMVETLQAMLGDYADTVAPEVLLQKNESGGNTPELAKLKSIRFAPSSETDTKRKLAEALVKRITGGDLITACAKYGHPFTYKPEFKLWLATNKKPTITGTDLGIWSRIKMIPFLQKFEGKAKDAKLKETLRAEMLGILAWAVRGAVAWYQQGLGSCAAVDGATEDYREESDTVARFLKDCCIVAGEKYQMSSSLLYSEYKRYCEAEGETSLNQVDVRKRLVNLGHEWKRLTPGIFWKGISLKPCEEEQEGDSRQTAITQTPIGSNVYAFPTLPIDLERRTA